MQSSKRNLALFCAFFIIALSFCFSNQFGAQAASSTYGAAPLGSLAQPAKGSTYTDPTFGTKVLRLTDSADANSVTVAYSYWPTFNYNSTKLIIALEYNPYLYNFDANNLTFQKVGPLFSGDSMQFEGLSWSASDANTIYGVSGYNSNAVLRAYNVSTKQFTVIHDFTAAGELPVGTPKQMSKARSNDRYFSFHWIPASSSAVRYAVVYDKELNKTYLFDVQAAYGMPNFDECRLDRDGKFLTIVTGKETYVWQFATQQASQRAVIAYNSTQRSGGHYDLGTELLVHSDPWGNNGNRVIKANLNSPGSWTTVFDSGVTDWNTAHHLSMLGPDDTWALITSETSPANYNVPFTNEIFLAKTDGSGAVLRLVHPNTSNNSYEHLPFANLSPDGRFIAYNSDWNGGHCDVYIAAVPPNIWSSTTTPTTGDPSAQISANTNVGSAPLSIIFNGTATSPNGSINSYNWNFGDGTSAAGATVSHSYTLSGNYNAVLTVTDSANKTATSSITIAVSSPLGTPVATFNTNLTTGNAPLNISFDASTSSSPNGSINSYSWNFGDGTSATGATSSHSYNTAGSFTAQLTITDSAGKTASTSKVISVNATTGGTTTPITLTLRANDGQTGSITKDVTISATNPSYTSSTTTNNSLGGSAKYSMLVAFPSLIGNSSSQIPAGAKIVSAKLTLTLASSRAMTINMARILDPDNKGMWSIANSTGNNVGVCYNKRNAATGISWSNTATNILPTLEILAAQSLALGQTTITIDVTSSVAAWINGAVNQGWLFSTTSNNLSTFYDSSNAMFSRRPSLTIVYTK